MVKTVSLSDETYARLEALAKPFEDHKPEDVIRRLLDNGSIKDAPQARNSDPIPQAMAVRAPRERGVEVELDGRRILATTVRDLCTKVMEHIYSKGLWEKFESLAPYRTSAARFLFAKSPKHPRGNDFFVQQKYRNIYMEAHKDYKTTIGQLHTLLSRLGITLKYVQ